MFAISQKRNQFGFYAITTCFERRKTRFINKLFLKIELNGNSPTPNQSVKVELPKQKLFKKITEQINFTL